MPPLTDFAWRKDAAEAYIRPPRPSPWPWLFSIFLHGLLLAALLQGLPSGPADISFHIVTLVAGPGDRDQSGSANSETDRKALAPAADPVKTPAAARRPGGEVIASSPAAGQGGTASGSADSQQEEGKGDAGKQGFALNSSSYTVDQVDRKPRAVYTVQPVYPYLAQRRGIEGWVEVRFLVNRDGLITREEVTQAQPEGIFENSALKALRAWRFSPGLIGGRKVDTWMVQVIRFKLVRPG
ncbi:MAG: energy transducer TonB [Desulfarculales bacterium]|nr:energy transducer TonB [Desulfarculales bacterium]